VVCLSLHGAMAAESALDTEGVILTAVRECVGSACFVCVTLDHHANITAEMVDAADLMVGYETQPHDLFASGEKTARIMKDVLQSSIMPKAALVKTPMLAPQDNFLTCGGPMKEWFDLAREMEKDDDVIVVSPFPTQPWLDVPDNGWSSLVYALTTEKAQSCAETLAKQAWELREDFWKSERLSIPETLAQANVEPKGLVVISDTGDAVFAGAPGDSTSILSEMLTMDLKGPALAPMVDPEAFDQALRAGIGKEIALRLGGKMSSASCDPIEIRGTVSAFTGPDAIEVLGVVSKVGRTALVEQGQLKIVLMEKRDRTINHPLLYQRLGIDISKAQMVVLKTGSNFQYFAEYQSRLIRANSPGASQSDLTAFNWKHRTRPMYPFEDIKIWSQFHLE